MTSAIPTTVDICICTFRRAHLLETLLSLTRLNGVSEVQIKIIIADNDDTPSAQPLVTELQKSYPYPLRYIHAPARNISIARNACLSVSTAQFIAFIDDDELATSEWLEALLSQHRLSKASIILGPVKSHYPPDCPPWLKNGDFHSIKPVWVKNKIITGYTSNVLIKRTDLPSKGLRFDERLGRTGGEDTAFFSAAHKADIQIEYSPQAIVIENVVKDRLSFAWLFKRYFRYGQTHATLLLRTFPPKSKSHITNVALAVVKALYCIARAFVSPFIGQNFHYWVLRGALHMGVAARLFGKTELVQYG